MTALAPIAVSMGDPAGIGPEIIFKAWSKLKVEGPDFYCIGDPEYLALLAKSLDLPAPLIIQSSYEATKGFSEALPCLPASTLLAERVDTGSPSKRNAICVKACIKDGTKHCLSGQAAALVTAPISKTVMYDAGFDFPGHTEFLAALTENVPHNGTRGPVMMLANSRLRVVLTSIHESLSKAVQNISAEAIIRAARITHQSLQQDFGIAKPRLALAGLNPHAGEKGALGDEEIDIINPAASLLRAEGIDISDATPPDTLFHAEARALYDAAICLYHDQGLIPVKTLDFHGGVNITLGLPIIRTSPDHGTAFDIAGTGQARPDSLIAAIKQARTIAGHRQ